MPAEQHALPLALPTGKITLKQGHNRYSVRLDDGEHVAQRAASCMLVPEVGDRVLVAFTPEPYVLAVLDRKGDVDSEIVLDGDAAISAPNGRLDIRSADGVSITSRIVSMFSEELRTRAKKASLAFEDVETVAGRAKMAVDEVILHAKTYDSFAERVTERAARVFRVVTEYDQLRARHFDYRAEESAQIKGRNTVMVAREVAKVDGENIHVG